MGIDCRLKPIRWNNPVNEANRSDGMAASSAERIDAVLANPRFGEARRCYIENYINLYAHDPALNKLMAEAARHVIVTFIICMSAAATEDPESWPTLGKLQDEVEKHGVGSAGLVENIVSRMLDRGLLNARAALGDRRKRVLSPTPLLLRLDREILLAQAIPTAMLFPGPAMDRAVACGQDYQRTSRAISMRVFGMAMEFFARNADAMHFIARDSGLMVLFSILSSAGNSAGKNISTISYQELTDRFGISRTHARSLIDEAEVRGWVEVNERGGVSITIKPALTAIADRYIADAMQFFAYCCDEAHKVLVHEGLNK